MNNDKAANFRYGELSAYFQDGFFLFVFPFVFLPVFIAMIVNRRQLPPFGSWSKLSFRTSFPWGRVAGQLEPKSRNSQGVGCAYISIYIYHISNILQIPQVLRCLDAKVEPQEVWKGLQTPHKVLGRLRICYLNNGNGTPKSSILIGCSIINHPFWGTHIFGNIQI